MIPLFLVTLFAFVDCRTFALLASYPVRGSDVFAINSPHPRTGSGINLFLQVEREPYDLSMLLAGRFRKMVNAIWKDKPTDQAAWRLV